jgi:hypothetical protein
MNVNLNDTTRTAIDALVNFIAAPKPDDDARGKAIQALVTLRVALELDRHEAEFRASRDVADSGGAL